MFLGYQTRRKIKPDDFQFHLVIMLIAVEGEFSRNPSSCGRCIDRRQTEFGESGGRGPDLWLGGVGIIHLAPHCSWHWPTDEILVGESCEGEVVVLGQKGGRDGTRTKVVPRKADAR